MDGASVSPRPHGTVTRGGAAAFSKHAAHCRLLVAPRGTFGMLRLMMISLHRSTLRLAVAGICVACGAGASVSGLGASRSTSSTLAVATRLAWRDWRRA